MSKLKNALFDVIDGFDHDTLEPAALNEDTDRASHKIVDAMQALDLYINFGKTTDLSHCLSNLAISIEILTTEYEDAMISRKSGSLFRSSEVPF